jgi:hypothetical protein
MYVSMFVWKYVNVFKYACKYVLCMDMIEYMYAYSFVDICIYHIQNDFDKLSIMLRNPIHLFTIVS